MITKLTIQDWRCGVAGGAVLRSLHFHDKLLARGTYSFYDVCGGQFFSAVNAPNNCHNAKVEGVLCDGVHLKCTLVRPFYFATSPQSYQLGILLISPFKLNQQIDKYQRFNEHPSG